MEYRKQMNCVVLISGEGTTFKSINEAIDASALNINLVNVISSKPKTECNIYNYSNKYPQLQNILYHFVWNKESQSRDQYESDLINHLKQLDIDLIICAGWNYVLSSNFISQFRRLSCSIINLHPALPNTFVGQNCIQKAYTAFQNGEIQHTGSMVHYVIPEVDKGEVLTSIKVPIFKTDSYEDLEHRQKQMEKGILIQAIQILINKFNENLIDCLQKTPYIGKVRCVEDIGYGCLLLSASDRLSAFDKHVCNVPNKGHILNNLSRWWFENTSHIIDNHYLYSEGRHMIVKKTVPIKLEIIIRGYMTGSSATSIWTMYKNGHRNIYGINFRDNYRKNEKLDSIVITPTTKGIKDVPITRDEIIEQNYLTEEEYDFVSSKALELFRFGQKVADEKGLILVDTKYEFGRLNNKIILIDELHTCDSSRYWLKDSYNERFSNNIEPEKLDKDCARDYIKQQCDPYKDEIPSVPDEIVNKIENVYSTYNLMLTNKELTLTNDNDWLQAHPYYYFENFHNELVVILAGSVSDKPHVQKLNNHINKKGYYTRNHFCSAHKNTTGVLDILNSYENSNRRIVYVTVAGRSNALSGVVACNTQFPVIACPPFKDKDDMMVNIHSTLQMPSKVPVMTILEPENVGISISRMFSL